MQVQACPVDGLLGPRWADTIHNILTAQRTCPLAVGSTALESWERWSPRAKYDTKHKSTPSGMPQSHLHQPTQSRNARTSILIHDWLSTRLADLTSEVTLRNAYRFVRLPRDAADLKPERLCAMKRKTAIELPGTLAMHHVETSHVFEGVCGSAHSDRMYDVQCCL